jgi:hypothetical protein
MCKIQPVSAPDSRENGGYDNPLWHLVAWMFVLGLVEQLRKQIAGEKGLSIMLDGKLIVRKSCGATVQGNSLGRV